MSKEKQLTLDEFFQGTPERLTLFSEFTQLLTNKGGFQLFISDKQISIRNKQKFCLIFRSPLLCDERSNSSLEVILTVNGRIKNGLGRNKKIEVKRQEHRFVITHKTGFDDNEFLQMLGTAYAQSKHARIRKPSDDH